MFINNFVIFFYLLFLFFILILFFIIIVVSHFIILLIFLDLILICNSILFIIGSFISMNIIGYTYALLLFTIAAADTAIGLGLFILYYKATLKVSIK